MDDSSILIWYSVSQFVAAIVGVIGIAFVAVGSYKLFKTDSVPWNKVLLFSVVTSIAISIIEWLVITLLLEPDGTHVLIGESAFLVLGSFPFLTACLAIYKLCLYASNNA